MKHRAKDYVNFLQKLALAISENKVDAQVRYVPVSHTPYVHIEMDGGFDELDTIRERMAQAISARGFITKDGRNFVKTNDEASDGFSMIVIEVGAIWCSQSSGAAVMELNVSGPYTTPQSGLDHLHPRKKRAERERFANDHREFEVSKALRFEGALSVAVWLGTASGVRIPVELQMRLEKTHDMSGVRRLVKLFRAENPPSVEDMERALKAGDEEDVVTETSRSAAAETIGPKDAEIERLSDAGRNLAPSKF